MIGSPQRVVRHPHSLLASTILEIHEGREGVETLFPHFVEHVKQRDPMVFVMKGLKMVSDLSDPRNWWVHTCIHVHCVYMYIVCTCTL